MKIKSLFISDLHLNTSFCQSDKLLRLLKEYEYENLFLLGDIIDFYPKKFLSSCRADQCYQEDFN